jgi:hypothetical protein
LSDLLVGKPDSVFQIIINLKRVNFCVAAGNCALLHTFRTLAAERITTIAPQLVQMDRPFQVYRFTFTSPCGLDIRLCGFTFSCFLLSGLS